MSPIIYTREWKKYNAAIKVDLTRCYVKKKSFGKKSHKYKLARYKAYWNE